VNIHRKIDRGSDVWGGIARHKLSPRFYWDPELYKDELDLIFQTTWVYVGHESEVGEPKTFVRKKVAGQELILTRSSDGEVHVLFNRCTHRGSLVCNADKGEGGLLRCMYHGWVFELDGALRGAPRSDAYSDFSQRRTTDFGLAKPAATEIYGGFIFCRLREDGTAPSFDDFIAPVRPSIDRLLRLSPNGKIDLTAGRIGHILHCNWKMAVESQVDNYHVNTVHQSLKEAIPNAFDPEEDLYVRHLGAGHTELDFRPQYAKDGRLMQWVGAVKEDRVRGYVDALNARHGAEYARQVLLEGPPHVVVFPNLFLSQMNIVVFDPISAEQTAMYTTPVFFEGMDDINDRISAQCSGAMGPAGLIIADDAEIGDRNRVALHTSFPEWLDISRGRDREKSEGEDAQVSSWGGDETPQRGMWSAYRDLMLRREPALRAV